MRRRIILFGIAIVALMLVASALTFRILLPNRSHVRTAIMEQLVRELADRPQQELQPLLDELSDTMRMRMSVYDSERTLIATNVRPPIDVSAEGDENGPDHFEQNGLHILAQAPFLPPSVARPSPKPPLLPIAIIVAVTLAGLIALAFPVAARMTRRLDNLAQVARRFGTGDLDQRADTSGRDEVSETAKAFNAMAQSISLSRRRERELLANVSHELRTPMARMQVLLELTQTKPDAAQRYVEELGRDFLELQQLLDTIIDTLRCDPSHTNEHAPWPMQPQETSLSRFLGEIAADFQARVPMRELVFQLPATDVLVQADHTLLRRALLNLLDNSAKYSPESSPIYLSLSESGEIKVTDQGRGIAQDDLPHVFEPFFRADRSRTRTTGGVGLGLAFVRRVVGLHGGDIQVESQLGVGTVFRVLLPTICAD